MARMCGSSGLEARLGHPLAHGRGVGRSGVARALWFYCGPRQRGALTRGGVAFVGWAGCDVKKGRNRRPGSGRLVVVAGLP